jgi:exosortase
LTSIISAEAVATDVPTHPRWRPTAAIVAAAVAFAALFAEPFLLLVRDWWTDPEAGHGLLLAPVAGWLAWRNRHGVELVPNRALGIIGLVAAVVLRYASGLAAELFTMRASMILALAALVVYFGGVRRLLAWWLPFALLTLSVPLPAVIVNSLALPLQFTASKMGAALLQGRNVPVRLTGNIILLPGHRLFVTEACSGLRSLTALLSLGVLAGGLWLRFPIPRALLVVAAIPIAVVLNGIRVFLTGFLVYFVDPALGEGFMHMTEGWLMFLVAFGLLGLLAWALATVERQIRPAH